MDETEIQNNPNPDRSCFSKLHTLRMKSSVYNKVSQNFLLKFGIVANQIYWNQILGGLT